VTRIIIRAAILPQTADFFVGCELFVKIAHCPENVRKNCGQYIFENFPIVKKNHAQP